jgi:uncharacterized protein YeaO (DUF488 family)
MVKIIRAYKFPDRKDNFRIMVDNLCSEGLFKEKIKLDLWLKNAECSSNRLANDSERWDKFQSIYKEEFDYKIRLIDKIWEKKKENLHLTGSTA